ncbi:uncharacterized protein BDV17DRAFT_276481 [Aspergillus undulatus]|uniref:uncharacterized protein n=1 Tax=Aspergillus undulatus TaxID=1810928 RepID=UPI003CCE2A8B
MRCDEWFPLCRRLKSVVSSLFDSFFLFPFLYASLFLTLMVDCILANKRVFSFYCGHFHHISASYRRR